MKTEIPNGLTLPLALGCLIAGCLIPCPVRAAFSWPGCTDVKEEEFRYQTLVGRAAATAPKVVDATLYEPIHMAFDLLPDNTTDIYWVERQGGVKRYIAAKNQVVKLGDLATETSPNGGDEQGLTGVALDPGFRNNHWLYAFYSPTAENNVYRVSRFTLNPDLTALLPASEKVVVRIPFQRKYCCHTAGAMAFDLYGDLWIAVGKNRPDYPGSIDETNIDKSTEATSTNAADMRGGIIRIHPDGSAKGYSIPAGNYGEYWSKQFKAKGMDALAAEYADTAKVLPEVYVKGARNPYSLTVDPVRRWVAWGEFGVNLDATMTEEHNLATHPMFGGYPYFAGGGGTGGSGCSYLQGTCELWKAFDNTAGAKDMAAPVNDSKWNKGPRQLPPAEPALHTYPRSGAITGPIYRYNGGSPSPIKFPPHFDKTWMVGDMKKQWIKIYKLNEAGNQLTDSLTWFTKFNFADVLDIQQGPDGALYVLNYAGNRSATSQTSIGRIEYTGSCRPAEPAYPILGLPSRAGRGTGGLVWNQGSMRIEVGDGQAFGLKITDARGQTLRHLSGRGVGSYRAADLGAERPGVYFAELETEGGARLLRFVRL